MNTIEVRRKGGLPFVISGPLIPRKVLQISYNLANLPESVEGTDGASLTHIYLLFGINRLRILAKSFSRSIPFLQYFSIFA